MSEQLHSALYYPSIEFEDPQWLWASSLIWDRIYRIVPKDYIPEDSDNFKKLFESGEIGVPIHPDQYAKAVSKTFIRKLRSGYWDAAALSHNMNEDYARLHHDKVDVQLREMIVAKGRGASHKQWLYVPTDFEALYMTYLARYISQKANLNLVTDAAPAWTGATYFTYDGNVEEWPREELPHVLAAMLIRDFIPTNIVEMHPKELLAFRENYRDERRRFVGAVRTAATQIANCHDAKIARDMYDELKKDIISSLEDYKKSMNVLKVEGWTGIKTLVFPAAASVIGKLFPLDATQLTILSAGGLAMGAVLGITSMKQKGKRLAREYDYSYLLHVQRAWQNCYQGSDLNYYLCRQMEEFIND